MTVFLCCVLVGSMLKYVMIDVTSKSIKTFICYFLHVKRSWQSTIDPEEPLHPEKHTGKLIMRKSVRKGRDVCNHLPLGSKLFPLKFP